MKTAVGKRSNKYGFVMLFTIVWLFVLDLAVLPKLGTVSNIFDSTNLVDAAVRVLVWVSAAALGTLSSFFLSKFWQSRESANSN